MNVIRHIQLRASQQGIPEMQRGLEGVARAQDTVSKTSLSMQQAFDKLQRRYDMEHRAQRELEKVQRDLDRARAQGLVSQQRASELMQLAIRHHNGAAQQVSVHARALQELQSRAMVAATSLGSVGAVLSGLGPVGLGVGAALGGLAIGFKSASDAALQLADRAGKLKDFSETTGFAVIELQALEKAGAQVGVSSESVTRALERFSTQMDDVKQATGPVYETLRQIDPALAQQIARTRSLAAAWDLFAVAARKADLEQRNVLARQTFNRSGIELTRLLGANVDAGGLQGLVAELRQVDLITAQQADRWDTLGEKLNENMKAAKQNVAAVFTEQVLQAQLTFSTKLLEVSRTLREMAPGQAFKEFMDWLIDPKVISAAASIGSFFSGDFGLKNLPLDPRYRPRTLDTPVTDPGGLFGAQRAVGATPLTDPGGLFGSTPSPALAAAKAAEERKAETIRAANENRRLMAVLGEAATPAEQLRDKMLQLAAATAKDATVAGVAARARGEAKFQYEQQIIAVKTSLGVATEEEIVISRLAAVRRDAARAGIQDAERLALANRIATKDAKEAFEASQIRSAALPGLKSFELEAANFNKQIDALAVGSLNNLTTGLTDITMGTKTAADGFRDLGLSVVRSVEEMIIKMSIALPIARALQGALSTVLPGSPGEPMSILPPGVTGSAMGNVFHHGNVLPFASGGVITRPMIFPMANGAGLAGEAGPEAIMPLRRGSNGALGVAGSAPQVNVNVNAPPGSSVRQQQSRGSDGSQNIDVFIEQVETAMGQRMTEGRSKLGQAMQGTYGARRRGR